MGLFVPARSVRGGLAADAAAFDEAPRRDDFGQFYEQWFDPVSRWVGLLGAPEADRDDVLQEVFLIVKRRLPAFDGANPAGWLYQITRRQVRDLRHRSWVKHIFTRRCSDQPDALPSALAHPEALLERKQQHGVLGAILAKMNEDRRIAFVLFEIDGLSGEEIAQIQGVRLNTIWSRLRKGREEFFELAAKFRRATGDDFQVAPDERARGARSR